MPRSLWKGSISFGLVNIPVVLYSAENRNSFDLTLLDRRDMKPVGFKRYNKESGKEVRQAVEAEDERLVARPEFAGGHHLRRKRARLEAADRCR